LGQGRGAKKTTRGRSPSRPRTGKVGGIGGATMGGGTTASLLQESGEKKRKIRSSRSLRETVREKGPEKTQKCQKKNQFGPSVKRRAKIYPGRAQKKKKKETGTRSKKTAAGDPGKGRMWGYRRSQRKKEGIGKRR